MSNKLQKLAFLGPHGTYSHGACLRFMPKAELVACVDIPAVFNAVKQDKAALGIVPFENSQTGLLPIAFDQLVTMNMRIQARYDMPVDHCLISRTSRQKIIDVYGHPQALMQCKRWLHAHVRRARLHEAESNVSSVEIVKSTPGAAMIASEFAAKLYRLPIQERGIQDVKGNMTRFWVVTKAQVHRKSNTPSFISPLLGGEIRGDFRHSAVTIYFTVNHQPGALVRVLEQFQRQEINLLHLHSHALLGKPWQYGFFATFAASASDPHFRDAAQHCQEYTKIWKILGSYPCHGSDDIARQRWWAINRLSRQLQPNRKIMYDSLARRVPKQRTPVREELMELRMLAAVSIGKSKWEHRKPADDPIREKEIMERKVSRAHIRTCRELQIKLMKALVEQRVKPEEVVDMPLEDARYYIDQIDYWLTLGW